jgi:signal transduction histidine kinase
MRLLGGAIAVLLLLGILTFLLLRGIWTDEPRYALELKAFGDYSLAEASLNRDILEARAGLLRNYDPIAKDVETLDDGLARLGIYAKDRALDLSAVNRLADQVAQREALVESFKTDNAILQNSLSYFGLLSTSSGFFGDKGEFAGTAGALVASILSLSVDSSSQSARGVEQRIEELERQAPSSGPRGVAPRALIAHARLLYDLLPAVDSILNALVGDQSRETLEALRAQFSAEHASTQVTAQRFRLLLYAASLLLLVGLVYLGIQLRARAIALRTRAAFEHIIAETSTDLINCPASQLGARLTQVLGALCRAIGVERAYIALEGDSAGPYLWSAAGAALPPGWPQRVLALATQAGFAGPGITRLPDVAKLPHGAFRSALQDEHVRAWACVPLIGVGRMGGIMAFEAFATARGRAFPVPVMRLAGDAVVNAIKRKLLERERAKLTARLERTSRMEAVGQFASGIAHNFNNIIAAILGYSELTVGELAPESRAASRVEEIREAAERGRHLVDSILTFGRRRDASRRVVSMRHLLSEATSLLRASLPKEVELNIPNIPEQLVVWGEPVQLQQVILNLCSNAAQAMGGRGRIEVAVGRQELAIAKALSHDELPPGSYIRLSVEDSGPGMDKAVERRLFEPFFTTRATGTGLGLATVREIVHDHEGAMHVTSLLMQGSRFEVWLPASGSASSRSLEDKASPSLGRGETVLIIENDRELLLRDEEMLAALGYEPIGFERGEEALAALQADPSRFDVAVIGVASAAAACALTRSLSERLGGRPLLLATTSAIDVDLDAMASAGVAELLPRPLVSTDLAAALTRCLRSAAPLPTQG